MKDREQKIFFSTFIPNRYRENVTKTNKKRKKIFKVLIRPEK